MKASTSIRSLLRSALALGIGAFIALLLMGGLARLVRGDVGPLQLAKSAKAQRTAAGPNKPHAKVRSKVTFLPRPAALDKLEAAAPKPKPVEIPSGQVVETARPASEEVPLNARYLGRYDMKVEREQ